MVCITTTSESWFHGSLEIGYQTIETSNSCIYLIGTKNMYTMEYSCFL